jgi:acetyl-CoA synthetase
MSDVPAGRRSIDPATATSYEAVRDGFAWGIPDRVNLGVACADDHPAGDPALAVVGGDDGRRDVTFGELAESSTRLADGLAGLGVERGDRVGLVLPQSLETGVAHLAVWKLGAVSLPLASLFGPDALAYRLSDSGARVVVTTPENLGKVEQAIAGSDDPPVVVVTGDDAAGHVAFDDLVASGAPDRPAVDSAAEDPAYLIYTSGTTGQPKGALHAHRSLYGHLPGFELYYELAPQPGDLIWTPADWAWIGGLMDVLVPAWFHGMPVLTAAGDFSSRWAADLIAEHRVTLAFLPPTALKMMRRDGVRLTDRPDGSPLRAVFTGGEALGEEMLRWSEEALGCGINEGYGQTECNLVVGNCGALWPVRPGSMGRALPGHDVVVLDDAGRRVVGERGEIAVRAPDPVMMLEYWHRPDATAEKVRDGWLRTGDLGVEDDDGYLWFVSRADDVISSRGYRIGPGEIEESLMGHRAVAMAAVVGVPDDIRGQVPKAFVVLKDDAAPSDALADELREHVRTRLAAHEVPREVAFIEELPRTTTGKVRRRDLRGL